MAEQVASRQGLWEMPIRKLAPLSYPFEQLHGRCAALAERICQIYVDDFLAESTIVLNTTSLWQNQKANVVAQHYKEKKKH